MDKCKSVFVSLFSSPFVGREFTLRAFTKPPGLPVVWEGDLGNTPTFTVQELSTIYLTTGRKALVARCEGATFEFGVNVRDPLPPPGDPFPLLPLGLPEAVPDVVYIVRNGPVDDDFLSEARNFHSEWNLIVHRVSSIEEIIDDMLGRSGLDRIRIVSHAAVSSLFMGLFRNDAAVEIGPEELAAFAESEVQGMTHLVGDLGINLDDIVNPATGESLLEFVLGRIRDREPDVLVPFTLEAASTVPRDAVRDLFQRNIEASAILNAGMAADEAQAIVRALHVILDGRRTDGVRKRVRESAPVTIPQIRRLEAAIGRVNLPAIVAAIPGDPDYFVQLRAATDAMRRGFASRLDRARRKLAVDGFVDVRGCNIAEDPAYLTAVSQFFGRGATNPFVTGPEWVMGFARPLSRLDADFETDVEAAKVPVQKELAEWAEFTEVRLKAIDQGVDWDNETQSKRLDFYLDSNLVLPIEFIDPLTADEEEVLFLFGEAAMENWLASQWRAPERAGLRQRINSAKNELGQRWRNTGQPPPVATISRLLTVSPMTVDQQETFFTPDRRYANHIISGRAVP